MGEGNMRQKFLVVHGAVLIAAVTLQTAAAAGYHHVRKEGRALASAQLQNSNAYVAPAVIQPDWSRYSGGISAPAGR
jgi:hypothetical protein